MSRYICNDYGTGFAASPPRDCISCGSGNIAMDTDGVPEKPAEAAQIGTNPDKVTQDSEYINKMLRHLLADLCEQVCSAPAASDDFRDNKIERTIERLRPYLVSDTSN